MSKLSKNLKMLRSRAGWSQELTAHNLGMSRSRYSAYEEYRAEPNISNLIKISELFEVSIDDLLKTIIK